MKVSLCPLFKKLKRRYFNVLHFTQKYLRNERLFLIFKIKIKENVMKIFLKGALCSTKEFSPLFYLFPRQESESSPRLKQNTNSTIRNISPPLLEKFNFLLNAIIIKVIEVKTPTTRINVKSSGCCVIILLVI